MNPGRLFIILVGFMVTVGLPGAAFAANGTATGQLVFHNALGNYCPSSRDCTGAKYPQSQFNIQRPVRHTKVYVRDQNDVIVGQGTTSATGSFAVSWYSPSNPSALRVTWHLEHKDNRFRLLTASGTTYNLFTVYKTPVLNGGDTVFGKNYWGTSAAPYGPANQYDAAFRFSWDTIYYSNVLQARFTNVRIHLNSTYCGDASCSSGSGKEIWMVPGSDYSPQERLMHEMGHAASDLSHRDGDYWTMVDYCYPSTGSDCHWSNTTPEWSQISLEEAAATFFATVALYAANAKSPHTCRMDKAPCSTGLHDVEVGGNCATGQFRWPLTNLRAYWDMFDTRQDGLFGLDIWSHSLDTMVNTFGRYPNGRGNREKNDGWGCPLIEDEGICWHAGLDDRTMWDYRHHLTAETGGQDPLTILYNNCY